MPQTYPTVPIPAATAALARDLFSGDTIYQFIGEVLFDQFLDEDFAGLYPKDGQPALSPHSA